MDDGGDCAEYIRKTLAAMDGVQPDQADPVEAAEVQQEREAIREEIAEHCSTTKCQSYKREVQK